MIQEKIKTFIKKKTSKKINNNTNLIAEEIMDSFSIVEICSYFEEKLNLKCPIEKVSTSNFNSINLILKFLKKYNKSI